MLNRSCAPFFANKKWCGTSFQAAVFEGLFLGGSLLGEFFLVGGGGRGGGEWANFWLVGGGTPPPSPAVGKTVLCFIFFMFVRPFLSISTKFLIIGHFLVKGWELSDSYVNLFNVITCSLLYYHIYQLFKCHLYWMVKHTQTICRLLSMDF